MTEKKGAEQLIQEANLARLIKASAADMLIDQQEAIVRNIVNRYETGRLDAGVLFGAAGELAALKKFTNNLDKSINIGIKTIGREVNRGKETKETNGRFRRR